MVHGPGAGGPLDVIEGGYGWKFEKIDDQKALLTHTKTKFEASLTRTAPELPPRKNLDHLSGDARKLADILDDLSPELDVTTLDSLKMVALTSRIQKQFGVDTFTLQDAMQAQSMSDLADKIETRRKEAAKTEDNTAAATIQEVRKEFAWWCGGQWWTMPTGWLFDLGKGSTSEELRTVIAQIAQRHPACHSEHVDGNEHLGWAMAAGAMAAIVLEGKPWVSFVRTGIQRSWPRIRMVEPNPLIQEFNVVSERDAARKFRNIEASDFKPPFHVVLFKESKEGSLDHFYCGLMVTHAFSDGASLNAFMQDFDNFIKKKPAPPIPNAFEVQEKRLFNAMSPSPPPESSDFSYQLSQLEKLDAVRTSMWLHPTASAILRRGARLMNIPEDVCVMALVWMVCTRMHNWDWVPLALMAALRDGDGEQYMVGFMSDWREIDIPCPKGTTVIGFMTNVMQALRSRQYRKQSLKSYDERHRININYIPLPDVVNVVPGTSRFSNYRAPSGRAADFYIEHVAGDYWGIRLHHWAHLYGIDWHDKFKDEMDAAIIDLVLNPSRLVHNM